ncbi:hypothetical protein [Hydrogenophaga sp. BPS33]|uniref:hypothetical protein n=1 Tax=Hydrogenophaga sp. BPS33 TaxID=2651974 RepID=UPI00131FF1EF|nr:hypothetical protein [Hydrogenophaga sp. BPS33]QHE85881.1 hypothetical protein F9K07_13685 [Hydrogenophaga sp. BPS33]
MALTPSPVIDDLVPVAATPHAVSWPAIFAGAAGAAALSLILLVLGTGLGLSSVSPWVQQGVSATTFGVSTIVWICFTQIVASGMGGYLAGRLRTRWVDTQVDEIYFRDTAHGFLAWAVASLATAALLTSVIASIVGGGAQAGATVAAAGMSAAGSVTSQAADKQDDRSQDLGYFVHGLFREVTSPNATPGAASTPAAAVAPSAPSPSGAAPSEGAASSSLPATQVQPLPSPLPASAATPLPAAPSAEPPIGEATGIFLNALKDGSLPADDVSYLGQRVAEHTGLNAADAQKRVTDAFARVQIATREAETTARAAADEARAASAKGALWLFLSLLFGAFFASLAATFGGRQRDAF